MTSDEIQRLRGLLEKADLRFMQHRYDSPAGDINWQIQEEYSNDPDRGACLNITESEFGYGGRANAVSSLIMEAVNHLPELLKAAEDAQRYREALEEIAIELDDMTQEGPPPGEPSDYPHDHEPDVDEVIGDLQNMRGELCHIADKAQAALKGESPSGLMYDACLKRHR